MSTLSEAATKVVEVLTSFTPDERIRIVKASLTLLGDDANLVGAKSQGPGKSDTTLDSGGDVTSPVHGLAQQWVKKTAVTQAALEHYFHFDQGRVIPIELPGNATSKREQTMNAYLAVGLAAFLETGDSSFADSSGREFCEKSGCFDSPNHAKYLKAFGNKVTGSKTTGWKLTVPGLNFAAELVKQPKT